MQYSEIILLKMGIYLINPLCLLVLVEVLKIVMRLNYSNIKSVIPKMTHFWVACVSPNSSVRACEDVAAQLSVSVCWFTSDLSKATHAKGDRSFTHKQQSLTHSHG